MSTTMLVPLLLTTLMVKSVRTTDLECYDAQHPRMYTGHTAVTESGTPCQEWASQAPHPHALGDAAGDFTDGEMPAAYCRSTLDGDDADKPWCYTTDEHVRWEFCDVPQCSCTGDFEVYGGSCYVYVNNTASWQDAQTHCSSLGGFLAEVKAFDQSDFLQELIVGAGGRAQGAWLGGTYGGQVGRWAWAASGEDLTYTNWAIGEPSNLGSQPTCLETNQHNEWRASGCAEEIDSICQKTPNELPNDGRTNILANSVDQLQTTMGNLTNSVQELTQKQIELVDALQEARHVESGTFQCGTFNDVMSHPVQTYEETFANAYLTPPTVHVSLAKLDTNVDQRHLEVTFAVNSTSNTGFKVVCEHRMGRHYSKLWALDLTWISIPSVDVSGSCDEGFTLFRSNCYAYINNFENWSTAQTTCRALGGFLAEIQNKGENDFIMAMGKNHSAPFVWIGGSDLVEEGAWIWSSSGEPITEFTDWATGQPDLVRNENCLEIRFIWNLISMWNDDNCDIEKPFVCQKFAV